LKLDEAENAHRFTLPFGICEERNIQRNPMGKIVELQYKQISVQGQIGETTVHVNPSKLSLLQDAQLTILYIERMYDKFKMGFVTYTTCLSFFHHYISGIIGNREESTPINVEKKSFEWDTVGELAKWNKGYEFDKKRMSCRAKKIERKGAPKAG